MKAALLLCVVALAVTGCGDTVTVGVIERAQKYCGPHGGLDKIETAHLPVLDAVEFDGDIKFHCKNGTVTNAARTVGQ